MFPLLSKNRQLFINDRIIEVGRSGDNYGSHNLKRVLHKPQKSGLVVIPDREWESPVLQMLSNNVIYDETKKIFRMWYSCFQRQWYEPCNMDVENCRVLYAESEDGVIWEKPNLGIYEYNKSTDNNICLIAPGNGVMWAGVLEDKEEDQSDRRFKMLGHGTVGKDHGVVTYFSPDGLHWQPNKHNPVLYARIDCGDSHTLMGLRDPRTGRYVAGIRTQDWYLSYPHVPYYRYRRGDPQAGDGAGTFSYRRVGISFSDDFMSWSVPQQILKADLDDPMGTQMQGMTFSPYEDVYLGFVMMHYADGINDTIDVQLAVSDDLLQWERVGNRSPFITIGKEEDWESKMIFAVSATPIRVDNELWLYYNPHRTTHYAEHEDRYAAIGLCKLRLDGFVSILSEGEGFLVTKPFSFSGKDLHINADSRKGKLQVEVLNEKLQPYEGYMSRPCSNDNCDYVVAWPDGTDLHALEGKPVRLKFYIHNTHLYSFSIK